MELESRTQEYTKGTPKPRQGFYARWIKRPMDFLLALLALIVLSPLLFTVAVLVRIKLGRPVIFKQERPGLHEKIFTLYKFRTMNDARDEKGDLLPDGDRLTHFGKMLRSTSLDELPELWNILKGDMSVVGPRPQLIKDMIFMTEEQRTRHSVRPGLTGLAQIRGRNDITWEDKLAFDLEYLKRITFIGDIKIILQTCAKVLKSEGVSTDGMDTAEDYGDYLLRTGKIDVDCYVTHLEKSNRQLNL